MDLACDESRVVRRIGTLKERKEREEEEGEEKDRACTQNVLDPTHCKMKKRDENSTHNVLDNGTEDLIPHVGH